MPSAATAEKRSAGSGGVGTGASLWWGKKWRRSPLEYCSASRIGAHALQRGSAAGVARRPTHGHAPRASSPASPNDIRMAITLGMRLWWRGI